jgi:ABC-type Mn2+/Zn2+ transport system ATPase subunit
MTALHRPALPEKDQPSDCPGGIAAEAIFIDHLAAGYRGQSVLREICLRLEEGRSVGIAGPNGAGKTTLFKVLLGLLPPMAGEVKVMGRTLKTEEDRLWVRRQIGYVPQQSQPGQLPVSVQDAVLMGRWGVSFGFFRRPSALDWQAVRQTLAEVGLASKALTDCRDLSGGGQQKVAIARALVRQAPILLLDEPTSYLDQSSRQELIAILGRIARQRRLTVVTISHDAVHLNEISEEIFTLEKGEFKEKP